MMFPQSGITVHELGSILTAIRLRNHMGYVGTTRIGDFIKLLSGERFDNKSSFNQPYMQKHYNYDKKGVLKYFFHCGACEDGIVYVTSEDSMTRIHVVCQKCSHKQNIPFKNPNYLISIDLGHQFHQLLQSERIREEIIVASVVAKQKARSKNSSLSSGSHGDLYKRLPIDDPRVIISLNASTDGAPVAENSVQAMWPVTVRINELTTPDSSSHTISCGMMIVDKEPNPKSLNL
ncbi:hypothetical protein QAD02_002661 [Eretmocerus hayati]|uniref:Uncharacterized protein n=1 Tax=Eretmocerus hayati TaxID=131215 RepID=A0ACC2NJY4_9HYME|nr:hypothetical protein QAD02_002661 [Eretmocerus hayati]